MCPLRQEVLVKGAQVGLDGKRGGEVGEAGGGGGGLERERGE